MSRYVSACPLRRQMLLRVLFNRVHPRWMGVVFAITAASATAGAPEQAHTMVLLPQIHPTAAPELRDRFHDSVARGWRSGQESPSAAEMRLRLGSSEELLRCSGQPACAPQAAEALHASRLIAAEITVDGKDYTVELRLVDQKGRELLKAEATCEICTLYEADEAVAHAAARLAAAARSFPMEPVESATSTETRSPPPSAVVAAPSAIVAAQPSAAKKASFPYRPVAIASAVGGLVLLIAGIPLAAIDGRPTCDRPDPVHSCPEVYNTLGGGATLLAFGALGLVASVPLFYFDARSRLRKRSGLDLRLGSHPGGGFVSLSGRF